MSEPTENPKTPDIDDFTRGQLMLELVRGLPSHVLTAAATYDFHRLLDLIARDQPGSPMTVSPHMSLVQALRGKPELWRKVRPFVQPGSRVAFDGDGKTRWIPYKL